MISVPRGKDDLSLYRGIPSPLALAPWGFGQLLPAVSFSSCEFCNEQRNVLSVSLHPFTFRKRHWSTRYTQFAMILAGVLLGQIPCLYAPFGANTAYYVGYFDRITYLNFFAQKCEEIAGIQLFPRIFRLKIQIALGRSSFRSADFLLSAAFSIPCSLSNRSSCLQLFVVSE